MIIFPFEKVEKGSRVVLYGMGKVGKIFYEQVKSAAYCDIVGWSDRHMGQDVEPNGILVSMEQIKDLNPDYVVIAIADEMTAAGIKKDLQECGVDPGKMIWQECRLQNFCWPDDMMLLRQDSEFYLKIIELSASGGSFSFYQSFPALGLRGVRPTEERLEIYKLKDFLRRDQDVLDIGCNCGFFDMQIAESVKSILRLEYEPGLIQAANLVKEHLHIDNCTFIQGDCKQSSKRDQNSPGSIPV